MTKRLKPFHYSDHVFCRANADDRQNCYTFAGDVQGLGASMNGVLETYHGGGMLGAVLVEWRKVGLGVDTDRPAPTQLAVSKRLAVVLEGAERALTSRVRVEGEGGALAQVQALLRAEHSNTEPHLLLQLRPLVQLLLDLCADMKMVEKMEELTRGATLDPGTCCRAAAAFFDRLRLAPAAQERLTAECHAGTECNRLFVPFLRHEFPGYSSHQRRTNSACAVMLGQVLRFVAFPARRSRGGADLKTLCDRSGELARALWLGALPPAERAKHEPERPEATRLALKLFNALRFLATRARPAQHASATYGTDEVEKQWFNALSCTFRDAPRPRPTRTGEDLRHGGGVLGGLLEEWCRVHVAARDLPGEATELLRLKEVTPGKTLKRLREALDQASSGNDAQHFLAQCDPGALLDASVPDVWPLVHLLLALQGDATLVSHLAGCLGADARALGIGDWWVRPMAVAMTCYVDEEQGERTKFSDSLDKGGYKNAFRVLRSCTRNLASLVTTAGGPVVVGELLAVCLAFLCAPAVAALGGAEGEVRDSAAALLGLAHNHDHRPLAGADEVPVTLVPLDRFRLAKSPGVLFVQEKYLGPPKRTWVETDKSYEPWPVPTATANASAAQAKEDTRVARVQQYARFDLEAALLFAVRGGLRTSVFFEKNANFKTDEGKRTTRKCHAAKLEDVRAEAVRVDTALAQLVAACAQRAATAALLERWLRLSRGPMARCCAALQRHKAIGKRTRALLVAVAHAGGAGGAGGADGDAPAAALAQAVSRACRKAIVCFHEEEQPELAARAEQRARGFLDAVRKECGVEAELAIGECAEALLRPPPTQPLAEDAQKADDQATVAPPMPASAAAPMPAEARELYTDLQIDAQILGEEASAEDARARAEARRQRARAEARLARALVDGEVR